MSGYDEAYAQVRSELAATPNKRVLLVEGTGDVEFLTFLLDKPPLRELNAHAGWVFGAAGGKDSVLRMLEREPTWVGLVDRDAWSEQEIQQILRRTPNLRLLPRYCIENYAVDPGAFGSLADQVPPERVPQWQGALTDIDASWPHAIRHGSLWRAVQPLQDALQELGFNGTLLRFQLPDDGKVWDILCSWSELMNAERVYEEYGRFYQQGCAMSAAKAQRLWVHGKMFWRHVVAPALGDVLGEANEARLRRQVMRRMPLPDDMRLLLEELLTGEQTSPKQERKREKR